MHIATLSAQEVINFAVSRIIVINQDSTENYISGVSDKNRLYFSSETSFYNKTEPISDFTYSQHSSIDSIILSDTKEFAPQEIEVLVKDMDSVNAAIRAELEMLKKDSLIKILDSKCDKYVYSETEYCVLPENKVRNTNYVYYLNASKSDTIKNVFSNPLLICNKEEKNEIVLYDMMQFFALFYSYVLNQFGNTDSSNTICLIYPESMWTNTDNYYCIKVQKENNLFKLTSIYGKTEFPEGLIVTDTQIIYLTKNQYKKLIKKSKKETIGDSYWRGKIEPFYLEINGCHYLISYDTNFYTPLWSVCYKLMKINRKIRNLK